MFYAMFDGGMPMKKDANGKDLVEVPDIDVDAFQELLR